VLEVLKKLKTELNLNRAT